MKKLIIISLILFGAVYFGILSTSDIRNGVKAIAGGVKKVIPAAKTVVTTVSDEVKNQTVQ